MKYDRFEKWMTRIKIPWWVFYENVNGCNYNDLRKMLLKAYKLGIKHSQENTKDHQREASGGSDCSQ
jgi:hypothetical protein